MCHWKKRTAVLLCTLLVGGTLAGCGTQYYAGLDQQQTQEAQHSLSLSELRTAMLEIKRDLMDSFEAIAAGDVSGAKAKTESAAGINQTTQAALEQSLEKLSGGMPYLRSELENARDTLELMALVNQELLSPLVAELETTPLTELRQYDGIRVDAAAEYLEFADSRMPVLARILDAAKALDLGSMDSDGQIARLLEQADRLLTFYNTDSTVFARFRRMLGAEGDRLYLVAVQDTAEIRACGGYPGYMGTLRVRDGVIRLGEINRSKDILSERTSELAGVTPQEYSLFVGGLNVPRNAEYCPDFTRVGQVWALGYQDRQGEAVDGVISLSPAVLQKMLGAVHEEIKLFDGNVLDGENAARVMQHDLYFQYHGAKYVMGGDVTFHQIYADAITKTAQRMLENLRPRDMMAYLQTAQEAIADRSLMLWMADETEQEFVAGRGWHGGLNSDPQNPQAGIYVNTNMVCKMGWYLILDAQMGSRVRNDDGSYTYPISVTLSNNVTPEELKAASSYITAGGNGLFRGSAYFFAPAGGTISDFAVSGGNMERAEYHGLQLGYLRSMNVSPAKPVTVTYKVTTAPGVETMLTFSKTPTVQDYH